MANACKFPEVTTTFTADNPDILPLPAHVSSTGIITSCHSLTHAERKEVAETGRVWLHCWGAQPPVLVNGINPFEHYELVRFDTPEEPVFPPADEPAADEPAADETVPDETAADETVPETGPGPELDDDVELS